MENILWWLLLVGGNIAWYLVANSIVVVGISLEKNPMMLFLNVVFVICDL